MKFSPLIFFLEKKSSPPVPVRVPKNFDPSLTSMIFWWIKSISRSFSTPRGYSRTHDRNQFSISKVCRNIIKKKLGCLFPPPQIEVTKNSFLFHFHEFTNVEMTRNSIMQISMRCIVFHNTSRANFHDRKQNSRIYHLWVLITTEFNNNLNFNLVRFIWFLLCCTVV